MTVLLYAAAALFAVSNAMPQPSDLLTTPFTLTTTSPTPAAVPGSCYTTWDDFEHETGGVKGPERYTYTSIVPSSACPTLTCAPKETDRICPLYIKVSAVTVPCATDCCPTTPTVYASASASASATATAAACPTCDPCKIPTELITYTTGCPGTPTITSKTTITPP
ncbi:hypothetical protein F4778DRAFT_784961 [Xylariomycetidae sp. FL2044]|nr:hypothetical protein F4778DRAFT_784961 [Xylariomycetidae sp. FL2044]